MKPMTPKLSSLPAAPGAVAAPTAPEEAPRRKPASTGNTWGLLLIIFIVVVTGVLAFPTFMILACGMLPALAAALIDHRPGRHASYCVIAANLAGIAPVLAALWSGGNSVAFALMLLSDVYVWLGMYSAAALGWALIWLFSIFTEFVLALMASLRVRKLYATQEGMVAEWGASVSGEEGDG